MKIEQFFYHIQSRFVSAARLADSEREVFSFILIDIYHRFQEGILYISDPESVDSLEIPDKMNILLLGGPNEPSSVKLMKKHPDTNFVFVSGCSKEELFISISDIFMEENRYNSYLNQLTSLVNSNAGLQALMDLVQSILGCPVIIMDNSYRVLALSLGSLKDDILELSRQQKIGSITEMNLSRMKRDRIFEQLRNTPSHLLYTKAPDFDCWWVNILITVHGIEVAEAGIMELDRKFTYYDFQLIRFLQQLISLEFQRGHYFDTHFGFSHALFVKELLERHFIYEETVSQRARLLNWKPSSFYFLMTIYSLEPSEDSSHKKMEIFVHRVQAVLPNCRWRISEENLVLIIPRPNESFAFFRSLTPFQELLAVNHLQAVLSNPFSSLLDTQKAYVQTMAVYHLRSIIQTEIPLLFYVDHCILHIADLLRESHDLRNFCHPCILQILAYDQENHTTFLHTLKEYLENISNPVLCSKKLHIHKNTLYYRINKLKDLFDLDLNDGSLRMHLQLSLELLRLSSS